MELYRLEEIDFKTKMKDKDIIRIAEKYIEERGGEYEINMENILYNKKSHITNDAVWYIDVISSTVKKIWPDAYDTLVISDKEKRLVYVMNDHGVVVESYI